MRKKTEETRRKEDVELPFLVMVGGTLEWAW
jgi:hypothetical protein